MTPIKRKKEVSEPKYKNLNFLNGKRTKEIKFDPYELENDWINGYQRYYNNDIEPRIEGIRKQLPHRPILFDQGFLNKRHKSITGEEKTTLPTFGLFKMLAKMESQHNVPSREVENQEDQSYFDF